MLIYDSGVSQSIGIYMNGFLKFSISLKYPLKTKTNDGICVWISDKITLYNSGVHTECLSVFPYVG